MSENEILPENENPPEKEVSLGLVALPPQTFEHDVKVSEKYQRFSTEILRLSLAAIGAVGFLIANGAAKDGFNAQWLAKNTIFGFWVVISLLCFGISAGLALLHLYFSADSEAYHLEYLRRLKSLGDSSKLRKRPERYDFTTYWDLYWNGKKYDDDSDKILKEAADERDVRTFLLKLSGKILLFSGISLWLGAITLVFCFLTLIFR